MYRTIEDFATDFKYESESTLKVFKELTDTMLQKKVHDKVRSAGFLAWHILYTLKEMPEKIGLQVLLKEQVNYEGETVKELCELYKVASDSLLNSVLKNWSNETLLIVDAMYGEKWKRGETLSILIKHQAHHRGQLEIIMRLCGLKVPGVYGPSNEDWAVWGMEAMQ